MRVLVNGSKKPLKRWSERKWRCDDCGRVVYLEDSDVGTSLIVEYDQDDREGNDWIYMICPVDGRRTQWFPVEGQRV